MRRPALVAAICTFALTACSGDAAPPDKAEGSEHIACALGGATEFREVCAVERAKPGDILTLTVRHPDGAFRRFEVLDDGRGLAVADGAKQAVTRYAGGIVEVAVDRDLYRFPATVKSQAARNADAEKR